MRSALIMIALFAIPASADKAVADTSWKPHASGEIRSAHGDWLAVCEEQGRGSCRAVFAARDEGSDAYFDTRVTLYYDSAGDAWTVSVMDRDMPASDLSRLSFAFGDVLTIEPGGWSVGEPGLANVAETVTLDNPLATGPLVAAMRANRELVISYFPYGSGDIAVSLTGVTSATNAIIARARAH